MGDPNDSTGRMSVTNIARYNINDGINVGYVEITKYQSANNYTPKDYIKTVKSKDNMNECKAKTKIIRKFTNDRMKYAKHLK